MAEVLSKNTPWEGKTGEQVENYIKDSLSKLIGVIYKDTQYDEYLCFNDASDRDTYRSDPSREDLVLARLDTIARSTAASITIISALPSRTDIDSTGNEIKYRFDIKDQGGASTGEAATVTVNITNANGTLAATTTEQAGQTITLNVDGKLTTGENIIKITVRGNTTSALATATVTCVGYASSVTETVTISGVSSLTEGTNAQFVALVNGGQVSATWSIVGSASGASINASSGILVTTVTGSDRSITIQAKVASGATATKRINIRKEQSATTGVTTIRINQNETDPDRMITLLTDQTAINNIRANSHRYLGKLSGSTMTICQLWDNNSNYYYDATTQADLTGGHGNVFMRLPKFWYKAIESSADVWDISFSDTQQSTEAGWQVWDDSWLIGVYKLSGGALSGGYKSVSGASFAYNRCDILQYDVYTQGGIVGYSLVDYCHHNIMAFLFYAYYAHIGKTNSQAVCGNGGSYDNDTVTGATDYLGMTDTEYNDKDYQRVNFWGLEDWWGGFYEWLGNGSVTYDNGEINWNLEGNIESTNAPSGSTFISRLQIGSNLSALPKELAESASETTSYCDEAVVAQNANSYPIARGGYGNNSGIVALSAQYPKTANPSENWYGSRLAFRGTIVEETNITRFKNM